MDNFTTLRASITETGKPGTITGTAVAYNVDIPRGMDLYERIAPGAFKAQMNAANRIPVLWQHNSESPIGRATKLTDSAEKLDFQALISSNPDVPAATNALALLREGIIDEMSIGFQWGTWHEERDNDKTVIVHTKARLIEMSVVTAGALGEKAKVASVHSQGARLDIAAYRARLAKLNS